MSMDQVGNGGKGWPRRHGQVGGRTGAGARGRGRRCGARHASCWPPPPRLAGCLRLCERPGTGATLSTCVPRAGAAWRARRPGAHREPHRKPAAGAEGPRRHRDLRHPRRLRVAAVPRDRALAHAAAATRCRTSPASASPPTRRRACAAAWRGRRDLRRRRLQPGQRGGRRLCRARAAGGAVGRAGGARGRQRPAAAPPGEDAGFAMAPVRGDSPSTAPGSTTRRRRRRRSRACSTPRCARSRPVYLEIPRDMPARPCDEVPPTPTPRCPMPKPGRLRRRTAGAPARRAAAGADGRRRGAPLRPGSARGRAGAAAGASRWSPASWAAACSPQPTCRCSAPTSAWPATPAVSEQVEHSDGLLLLGVIVSDTNFAVSARRIDLRHAIQAFDGEVVMGHHVYPDCRSAALVDALLERVPPRRTRRGAASRRGTAPRGHAPPTTAPVDAARHRRGAVNALMHEHGPMPLASDVGDCLFTAMDIEPDRADRAGLLREHGLRRAGGPGPAGGHRPAPDHPGRRRRVPDDRLGAGQRPPLRLRPDRDRLQQRELGDAARLRAGRRASTTWAAGTSPRWPRAWAATATRCAPAPSCAAALARAQATRGRFQLIDVRLAPGELSPTLAASSRRSSGCRCPIGSNIRRLHSCAGKRMKTTIRRHRGRRSAVRRVQPDGSAGPMGPSASATRRWRPPRAMRLPAR